MRNRKRWSYLPGGIIGWLALVCLLLAGCGGEQTVYTESEIIQYVKDVYGEDYRLTDTDAASKAGILAAALLCLLVCVLFFIKRKRITERSILFASLLLCCGLPMLLPHMHDRYFYFCDVLTLCTACLLPAAAPAVLLSQLASLLGYHAYFFRRYLLPMRFGFYGLVLTALLAAFLFLDALFAPDKTPPKGKKSGT